MRKAFLSFFCALICSLSYAQYDMVRKAAVTINGLQYKLDLSTHTAMLSNGNSWDGELVIPEQVTHEGETYTVKWIEWMAFDFCKSLTRIKIPRSIVDIIDYAGREDCKNPFRACTSLEYIEVDEENPNMCSVDGILFNKDKTRLFCYPAGAKSEKYLVPDGVTWIGGDAFAYNPYLVCVEMPNSVTYLSFCVFDGCKHLESIGLSENIKMIAARTFADCESLHFLDIPENVTYFAESVFAGSTIKTLVIRGSFSKELRVDSYYKMDDDVVIYVRRSDVENLKSVLAKLKDFSGTVLPLDSYLTSVKNIPIANVGKSFQAFDLKGRAVTAPQHGRLYIRNHKKIVWNE